MLLCHLRTLVHGAEPSIAHCVRCCTPDVHSLDSTRLTQRRERSDDRMQMTRDRGASVDPGTHCMTVRVTRTPTHLRVEECARCGRRRGRSKACAWSVFETRRRICLVALARAQTRASQRECGWTGGGECAPLDEPSLVCGGRGGECTVVPTVSCDVILNGSLERWVHPRRCISARCTWCRFECVRLAVHARPYEALAVCVTT
jgi:hypothetical protein